jgi:3-deoxy-D-manno-octulosonic-acid transferase
MWRLIYTVLVYALLPFFIVFSLAKKKIRKNLWERLSPHIPDGGLQDRLWLHAASIGEAVIAEDLIRRLGVEGYAYSFLLTTNTYYTRDLLRSRIGDKAYVCSLPFDLPLSLSPFFKKSLLKGLLLIETEIWPNLIWMAHRRGIPVIIVNGRISDRTYPRYCRLSFFFKKVFASVDLVLAQSQQQADRFVQAGADPSRVVALGNLKYARDLGDGRVSPSKEKWITFGSVKEREIAILIPVIERLAREFSDYRLYIAPREMHLVDRLEKAFSSPLKTARFSSLKDKMETDARIIIVDTVGNLISIYGKSAVAFVGGSLAPYGGQNPLEPLFFATPVLFGPYVENFKEITAEIVSAGAGLLVHDGDELFEAMELIIKDDRTCRRMGEAGLALVKKQKDVMDQAVRYISEITWKNSRN